MKTNVFLYLLLLAFFTGCGDSNDTPEQPVKPPTPTPTESFVVPIVFHVLYDDPTDRNQYIDRGRINEIVAESNKFFKANGANITVRLAETTPNGKVMDEVGVDRIRVTNSTFDPNQFMSDESGQNMSLLWSVDEYVNVFVYEFTEENSLVAGISHLPYTTDQHHLNGLYTIDPSMGHANLKYLHCLSINNTYIYHQATNDTYVSGDVTVTFTHELSHYLGVFHVFTSGNTCKDSDYCDDTETYNRFEYNNWVEDYFTEKDLMGKPYVLTDLVKRTNCSGMQFTSRNIMDYDYSYMTKLTEQQIARIYHVLNYSPLIPSQNNGTRSRVIENNYGPVDLPLVTIE